MVRHSFASLSGVMLAALIGASGCVSFGSGTSVFRGQDMAPMPVDEPVAPPVEPGAAPQQQHAQPGSQAYSGHPGYPAEYCPPGQGTYPAYIIGAPGFPVGCPNGHCGNQFDWYPRHHHTYSYTTPRNLTYPNPNMPSGAVVYPYYTLRGPSDFFRQK
jgi:hypothetical protein